MRVLETGTPKRLVGHNATFNHLGPSMLRAYMDEQYCVLADRNETISMYDSFTFHTAVGGGKILPLFRFDPIEISFDQYG